MSLQSIASDFPWALVFVAGLIVLCAVVWEKGWLGTATEARIKAQRDKWEALLKAKVSPAPPTPPALPVDTAMQISALHDLLTKGALTQAEFDAAKAKILAG